MKLVDEWIRFVVFDRDNNEDLLREFIKRKRMDIMKIKMKIDDFFMQR